MRIISILFALMFGAFLLTACSERTSDDKKQPKQVQTTTVIPMPLSVPIQLNAKATTTADGRVSIEGNTNLPDNTDLVVSLESASIGFNAQDESKVVNGQFSAGPLGPTSGLTSASYTVEVLMPIPSVQPENVKKVLGEEGQYMSGPLVKDSGIGGKIVEFTFKHVVGSQGEIVQSEQLHKEKVETIYKALKSLVANGRSMEKLRHTDDQKSARTCGELMRRYQSEAMLVREKAMSLSVIGNYDLRVASIEISSCVSCSDSALDSCDKVSKSLYKRE